MEQKEKEFRVVKLELQIQKRKEQLRFNAKALQDIHTPGNVRFRDRHYLYMINRSNSFIRSMLPLLEEAYNSLCHKVKYNLEK